LTFGEHYNHGHSQVLIVYSFVGLSEAGNNEIEGMSQRAYDEKMKRWSAWLETYLGQKRSDKRTWQQAGEDRTTGV
jgi:hypothetical protein